MTIWHDMQAAGLIHCGCVLLNGEVQHSCFPAESKKQLAVAKQALMYVFRSVDKSDKDYDEAHIEIGDALFSGFKLDSDRLLIFLSEHDTNTLQVRQFIDDNKERFLQL